MHKINFLPTKYREKNKNKVFYMNFIIFFIINTLLLINIFFYRRQIKDITKLLESNKTCASEKQINNKNKNISTINNFIYLYNFMKNDIVFSHITSNEKEIQFEGSSNNIKEYIDFLEKVEKDKKYNIKDFNNINNQGKGINFSVKMEVK